MMRRLPLALLVALLPSLAWTGGAAAQARAAAGPGYAQTERSAVALKQGMTPDEVEKLLGKPRRTALKDGGSGNGPSPAATLQWTYSWSSAASYSSSERNLQIEFAARAPQEWQVRSWGWSNYESR